MHQPVKAQSLTQGDVVIVGYNFTDPDEFSLLTLVDLPSGLQLYVTDAGWNHQTMSFRKGEGIITYTVPTGGIKAGSQIVYPYDPGFVTQGMNGFFGLALAGDQLLVFQGSVTHPDFIFGLSDYNGAWQINTSAIDNQTSHLPHDLQPGVTALALNHYVQAHFVCKQGFYDKQEFLLQLADPANWVNPSVRVQFPLVACDFSTLALHEAEWRYEWSSTQCLNLAMLMSQSERVSWWIDQGGEQIQLTCFSEGNQYYTCFLPDNIVSNFLLKPCVEQASGVSYCGNYRWIEKEDQEQDFYRMIITSGRLEISWSEQADEVFYQLYDLSGKSLMEGQVFNTHSLSIADVLPGCYVLAIIKDRRLARLKICSIE